MRTEDIGWCIKDYSFDGRLECFERKREAVEKRVMACASEGDTLEDVLKRNRWAIVECRRIVEELAPVTQIVIPFAKRSKNSRRK
jgi:hypothetical protein